jgi:Mg/Co/Ni transporter MgtE
MLDNRKVFTDINLLNASLEDRLEQLFINSEIAHDAETISEDMYRDLQIALGELQTNEPLICFFEHYVNLKLPVVNELEFEAPIILKLYYDNNSEEFLSRSGFPSKETAQEFVKIWEAAGHSVAWVKC